MGALDSCREGYYGGEEIISGMDLRQDSAKTVITLVFPLLGVTLVLVARITWIVAIAAIIADKQIIGSANVLPRLCCSGEASQS